MPSIALYYPWMHFQSDDWVKLALLTWDGVALMRAEELPSRDSALVRQVRDESDLVIDIAPQRGDLEFVREAFSQVIDEHRLAILTRHALDAPGAPAAPAMPDSNRAWNYAPEDAGLVWVYCGSGIGEGAKISDVFRSRLIREGLAVGRDDGGAWVGMRPELGSVYLAVLAETVGRLNELSPVTDDPTVHRASGSLDRLTALLLGTPSPAPALADVENAYVHVALRAVIEPSRLDTVPVAKILAFRERYTAELAAFRAHVAGLGEELARVAAVENLAVAHRHLEAIYRQQTKPQLTELRRALRGLGVDSAAGALGLRVDLGAGAGTVLGGFAAMGGQLAVAGAAVAVTVMPYLAGKFRSRRSQLSGSPVAYLLAADRKLAGKRLLRP